MVMSRYKRYMRVIGFSVTEPIFGRSLSLPAQNCEKKWSILDSIEGCDRNHATENDASIVVLALNYGVCGF